VTTTSGPSALRRHLLTPREREAGRTREPARRVAQTAVTAEPLDLRAHEDAVTDRGCGAVVSFAGVVRDHDRGRDVVELEYVAHPSAARVLAELAAEVATKTDIEAVAVSHRVGTLAIGEAALVVAVAGAHRAEAFAAASLLVDEIKHRLPVWKRQVFADGTDEWVDCP
jgi:molybdopterin synthase catalytic subunit